MFLWLFLYPFYILSLKKVRRTDLIIITLCLQTIAANVGCMVLPICAPHNIVMYTFSSILIDSFFLLLLPYIVVSLIFLLELIFIIPNDVIVPDLGEVKFNRNHFMKKVFLGVDYYLLLTFIALFILMGNLKTFIISVWYLKNVWEMRSFWV